MELQDCAKVLKWESNYFLIPKSIRNGVSKKPDGNDDDQKIFRISAVRPFRDKKIITFPFQNFGTVL